jgi:hypothetical protein
MLKRTWAVFVLGAFVIGCGSGPRPSPSASAPLPANQETVAPLSQAVRAARPGSEAGVVNAAIPERGIISVGGIPPERVHPGDVITIMEEGALQANVPAVVYATNSGYIQLRYEPLAAGQRPPRVGDIAVWVPGGPAVPLEAVQPGGPGPMPQHAAASQPATVEQTPPPPANVEQNLSPPATQPAITNQNAPPPATAIPTTSPAENTLPPTTRPADNAGVPAQALPPATQPAQSPARDLNK